jgi:hypothetical protein
VPGKPEPAFVGLADLQEPPYKQHGFRMFAHKVEVVGSNPILITIKKAQVATFFFNLGSTMQLFRSDCRKRIATPIIYRSLLLAIKPWFKDFAHFWLCKFI